jgi:signal transduction histidine kinase
LNLMLGPVEDLLTRRQADLPLEVREQLALVHRNGLRLLRLVSTLLDFSRIEAGRVRALYEATDLSVFTSELASVFRPVVEKGGLRLAVDCPDVPVLAFVDRDMWEKIVLNLLSNAFKFTFEGEIAVGIREVGGEVELCISDTGVGIAAEEIAHLFQRFHRARNVRARSHEGTGVGLALVEELARLHGGSVRVESAPGKGSTFLVTIPLGAAHLPHDQIGASRPLVLTTIGARPFVEEALRSGRRGPSRP